MTIKRSWLQRRWI